MDPVWMALVEFWWVGPTVIGAGALGWVGLRSQRTARARRLAYEASREALREARRAAMSARAEVRLARAEVARAHAELRAGRVSAAGVAAAQRALDVAQRETRAAAAALRTRRAGLAADRVALSARSSDPAALPLARLMASDDAITARWMEYETDAARLIAFPAMSDARVPETAAFLAELHTTRALRPASSAARITPAQFGAYRDGVSRLARAFDAAEAEAWRQARLAGSVPPEPRADAPPQAPWRLSAQEIAQGLTNTVLSRGAEVLARATARAREEGWLGDGDGRTSARGDDRTAARGDDRDPRRGHGGTPGADTDPRAPRKASSAPPAGGSTGASSASSTTPATGQSGTRSASPTVPTTPPPPQWPIPSRTAPPSRP